MNSTSKFQGLLALVIAAPHASAALSADGVELVDEDDAGGVLLGLRPKAPGSQDPSVGFHLW